MLSYTEVFEKILNLCYNTAGKSVFLKELIVLSKVSIKLLLILFICLSILSFTACARSEASVEQTASQPTESLCGITMEKVGQDVKVIGEITFIDLENPEGVYAELKEDNCRLAIWINQEEWESWTDETKTILKIGVKVIAEGKLQSFEGNLIIDLFSPLSLADSTISETAQENNVTPSVSTLVELNLVPEPLTEKMLDVELIYSGADQPGLCYLGSYAMLARFNDSSIEFTDVNANSGFGTNALYIPEVNILSDGLFLQSIGYAAMNQGFDYYIAALKGARITDDFMASDFAKEAKEVISLETEDEVFNLLKRLISSGIPVEVHLDCNFVKEALITYTSYWQTIFDYHETYLNKHADHYFVVTGYDQNFVYLNDPTEKKAGMGKDIPADISNFLEAWANGNHQSFELGAGIGPYWMLFLGERGTAKSTDELLLWNKDFAVKAPDEIRQAADNPNIDPLLHCSNMYRARKEFGTLLEQAGYAEAGKMFLQAADLFRGLCQSSDPKADLQSIADLQEQSLTKW